MMEDTVDLMSVHKVTHPNLFSHAGAACFNYLSNYSDLARGTEHTVLL